MTLACLDLEGVLIPEIWIEFAEKTGIDALKATTRDIPVYRDLMAQRLRLLIENGLGIHEIQEVVATMAPLPGAAEFLDWLRENYQVLILSDTFYEFSAPLMKQLGYPTVFCHRLEVAENGTITDFILRQEDQKRKAIQALHGLNFKCIAAGDSYNDTTMLGEANAGILFCPPENVIAEFPQFPVAMDYGELQKEFEAASARIA